MNANELRIGSLISLYRNPQDKEVCIGKIKSIYYSPTVYECYVAELDDGFVVNIEKGIKRITLTEEWLLKFGFAKEDENNFILHQNNIYFRVHRNLISKEFMCKLVDNYSFLIKSVHNLQNLYFSITNRELTVV